MATLKKLTRVGADVRQIAKLLQAKAPEGHMLAYITPEEAELLKSQGGSGKEHEDTGIPSFEMDDYSPISDYASTHQMSAGADSGAVPSPVSMNYPESVNISTNAAPAPAPAAAPVSSYNPLQPFAAPSYAQFKAPPAPASLPTSTVSTVPTGTLTPGPGYGAGTTEEQPVAGPSLYDQAKEYLSKGDRLEKLGLGGFQAVMGAYQADKARKDAQKAKEEISALAKPYQQQGQQLSAAAQRGELTPVAQQQLQAVQAQAAQQATTRGGVGAAQVAAQVEAMRNNLLQQQYDYGLKLSGIGDNIALGAIKTGLQADQYVQQLSSNYFTNIARTLYGTTPQQPGQQQQQPAQA